MRLAPFTFTVMYRRGADSLVADALSRMYTEEATEDVEVLCGALLESLTLVYSSLEEHQKQNEVCKNPRGNPGKAGQCRGFSNPQGPAVLLPQKG